MKQQPGLQTILLSAQLLQNAAKVLLEWGKNETTGQGKQFLNQQINRLNANKADAYSRIISEEGRLQFTKGISEEQALAFATIATRFFDMSQERKEMLELVAENLGKGLDIELVDNVQY